MALWPFRRKSGRKRPRSGAALSDFEGAPPDRSQNANDATLPKTKSQKKQRTEQQQPSSKKLQRRARTYSFSPGRNDSIRVEGKNAGGAQQDPGRPGRAIHADSAAENKRDDQTWQRVPTLHHSRNGTQRKGSKRRRDDHDREAAIKAMSSSVPTRPATDGWLAGRPMKKESKRVKAGGIGRNSRPTSDVSLPIPESIHSSLSSDSEQASYKISALDTLAPRPTLRYAVYPRYGPPGSSGVVRATSQRKRLTEPGNVPEATLKAHKRIDSLADGLDASDLRELMDRDKRRRDRKIEREQERMQRRLTRRAERQQQEEEEARRNGTPPPQNLERGVLGREAVGLGIDTTSAVTTSSTRRRSDASSSLPKKSDEAEAQMQQNETTEPHAEVLTHFHRTESIPLEPSDPPTEDKMASITPPESPSAKAAALRPIDLGSKTSLASEDKRRLSMFPSKSEESDAPHKDFETSGRGKLTLASFFKWGNKSSRRSSGTGPPSFSNTSREEMQAAQAHAAAQAQAQAQAQGETAQSATQPTPHMGKPPPVVAFTPKKMSSSVPKRTRSRFREDLPELPVSPPDSREVSPEAEPLPAVSEKQSVENSEGSVPSPVVRHDTPTSERRTIDETMRQTPTSMQRHMQNSPQPHSVSLASIDSEGSWLSGRIAKRSSSGMGMRDSIPRTYPYGQRRRSYQSTGNDTEEDLADDEYLSNLATPSQGIPEYGEGRPSSDDENIDEFMEDSDLKWGSVGARQPILHSHQHRPEMMRSHEGLLNFEEGSKSSASDAGETPHVEHATSINFGKKGHVRRVSAGSAKLLDITPRGSMDSRNRTSLPPDRRSSGSHL